MKHGSLALVMLLVSALTRATLAEDNSVTSKDKRGVALAGPPPHIGQSLFRLPPGALFPPGAVIKPYPVTATQFVPFQPPSAPPPPPPPRGAVWSLPPWSPITLPAGPSPSATRLSLLATNPDIAVAAAAAQHKLMEGLYHGVPGGPTKTGLIAARIAANPDIVFAAAAAQKQHGQHHSVYPSSALAAHLEVALAAVAAAAAQKRAQNHVLTSSLLATHPDVLTAVLAAKHAYAQHLGAQSDSEFLAQLAGAQPSLATLTAAAHLGLHH